jgi:imidazolonepropionase-like amidohydrolase
MLVRKCYVVVLISLCALFAPPVRSAEIETPTAITNVTIVARPGKVIEDGSILIDNGRIKSAGTRVRIPDHAVVIDGAGLWAYAGFIDAASHVGVASDRPGAEELARLAEIEQDPRQGPRTGMQRANRNGIWPQRTIRRLYRDDEEALSNYRKAGFTTALISPHPAILGGTGDLVQLSGQPLRSATVRANVTQIVSTAAQGGGYPSSGMGAVALLRQTYADGRWYHDWHEAHGRRPSAVARPLHDPVLESMRVLLAGDQRWIFSANTPNEIHHALDLADEFDQPIAILGGVDAWKVVDRLAAEKVPVIASLTWDDKPELGGEAPDNGDEDVIRTTRTWSEDWEDDHFEPLDVRRERIRQWEDQVHNVRTLIDGGVQVALTTRDGDSPGKLMSRLAEAIELGLDADDALAALTTAPASILGVDSELGEISSGHLANLSLTTLPFGDEDVEVRYTFVDGRAFTYEVTLAKADEDDEEEEDDYQDEYDGELGDDVDDEEESDPIDRHQWAWESEADRKKPIETGGDLLLRNANVITLAHGTLADSDILVRRGKIAAIGADLKAPRGVATVDLSGYWIMPGIVDPHSHMATTSTNEGSESITCEVRIADAIDHTQLGIHRALAGGVTTIHTMHGSANSIGGQNAVLKLKYNTSPRDMHVTSGPRIVKFALGENVTRANSRRRGQRFPGTRMGVESVMRQAFNDALEYKKDWHVYTRASRQGRATKFPRYDLRLEALNDILGGDIWVHSHCYRADEILRLLDVAQDYGFRIATLQHVLEGYRVAPEMYQHGVGGSTFSDWWAYKKEAYDAIPYNAAMMHRAGILTTLNSDSAEVIRHLNLEAAKTLRYGGLNSDEALRLITINAATQIGLDDRVGTIETGKDGDLAVFNGHPLDTFTRAVMTVVEGEVYFAEDGLLDDSAARKETRSFVPQPPREPLPVPEAGGHYAIQGATIHPVSESAIANGTIIIKDGLIAAVGNSNLDTDGAATINGAGLHVYPGLINASSRTGLVEISRIAGTVDTTEIAQFQPDLKTVSAFNAHSAHIGVSLCEGIMTTAILPSGGYVSGQGGLVQLAGWSMPEMVREPLLGLVMDLPSLPANIDGEDNGIDGHREAIEAIENFMEKAIHYTAVKQSDPDAIASDIRMEAMGPYVLGEKPVFFRAHSYKEILEAIHFAEEFDLRPIIVGGGEAWKCAKELAENDVPVIVTSVFTRPRSPFDRYDAFYTNAAKLDEVGVQFCFAAPGLSGDPGLAKQLPLFAGMSVAHGLSADQAIRSITLDAAKILGVGDRIGSLEPGKVADVIVTTGNPCQASTRTVAAFLAGQPVELTSYHEQNYQKFMERPAPVLPAEMDLRGPPPMRTN